MDSIFDLTSGTKDLGPNYYDVLGCSQHSSAEQINTEYKARALLMHPDKNPDDENAQNQFKELLEAKEILCDSKMRSKYDTWLNSGMNMTWKDWLNFTNKTQTVFHWAYQKPDPALTSNGETEKAAKSDKSTEKVLNEFRTNSNDTLSKFRNYQI